jgi:hypothetical protein
MDENGSVRVAIPHDITLVFIQVRGGNKEELWIMESHTSFMRGR